MRSDPTSEELNTYPWRITLAIQAEWACIPNAARGPMARPDEGRPPEGRWISGAFRAARRWQMEEPGDVGFGPDLHC